MLCNLMDGRSTIPKDRFAMVHQFDAGFRNFRFRTGVTSNPGHNLLFKRGPGANRSAMSPLEQAFLLQCIEVFTKRGLRDIEEFRQLRHIDLAIRCNEFGNTTLPFIEKKRGHGILQVVFRGHCFIESYSIINKTKRNHEFALGGCGDRCRTDHKL